MPSRAHTYTSPPPGDLTNPYLPPYITFRAYCIFSLPHYPPLFLPTPSSRPPMAAIIACYSVYAHYHQRVGMYVCEPARVGACMYAERGFRSFSLFRTAFCGPIDCGPAVRGRIGWISCQVTFQELFLIALTYHCLSLGDRRSRFGSSYRCSFGGVVHT